MRARRLVLLFLCVLLALSAPVSVFAQDSNGSTTEVTNEKKYDPLDLVVVLDSSGSMTSSDKQRTAISAVRMLVNMMPADSRVAVISFNTQPTVKTTNAGGKPALISLEAFANVETVRDAVDSIVYKGKTGIGNAVKAATDLLAEQGMPGRTKAIMVFTDGVNEFGNSALAQKNLADCEGNEVDAIQWAKENDTVIYCVGYNYKNSMGKNGEGLQKLSNMADQTGGKVRAITKVEEIQPLLVEFLADVCDLVYVPVGTIPGDGGFHECRIPVSPSVVEANIRIAGGNANSIKKGEIHLYDPSGNEVKLQNSGNVRFDVDANAASIKVVLPKPGEWLLTVNGIEGEDIHIGLLEHFKMNLTSTLVFPEGNPTGVAYSNDVIGIRSWLTYDGAALTDAALYDAVTSATATFISRANPEDKQVVTLTRDGMAFTGSFRIPADAYYDVLVRLDWDTVYREDTLTVKSNNKPPELKNEIADVKVNKGKTITLTDIYQYIYDDEGDPITASISFVSSPDAADVTLDADAGTVTITGKKWSSTLVTVQYKDNMGNVVESSFKVTINDPVAIALIFGTIVLAAVIGLLLMWLSYRKTLNILGETKLLEIQIDNEAGVKIHYSYEGAVDDGPGDLSDMSLDFISLGASLDDSEEIPHPPILNMRTFYMRKENRNLKELLFNRTFVGGYLELSTDDPRYKIYEYLISSEGKSVLNGVDKVKVEGSFAGIKGFTFKGIKKAAHLSINKISKKPVAVVDGEFVVEFKQKITERQRRTVRFKLKFAPSSAARAKARAMERKKNKKR